MKQPTSPKDTKIRILATALQLFNQQGLSQVTLRTIALELGISQGNLNYHFKKRDDILDALYLELVDLMDKNIAKAQGTTIELASFYHTSLAMMQHFYDYRFFMLDFVQIMREQATIRAHYLELQALRKMQFLGLFQLLIEGGLMRKIEFEGEYENLYIRMTIMGDFWLSSAITTQELSPDLVKHYCLILFEGLYPYFTAKGKEQFKLIML